MHIPDFKISLYAVITIIVFISLLLYVSKKLISWLLIRYKLHKSNIIFNETYGSVVIICCLTAAFVTFKMLSFHVLSQAILDKCFQLSIIIAISYSLNRLIKAADKIIRLTLTKENQNRIRSRKIFTHYRYLLIFLQAALMVITIAALLLSFDKIKDFGISLLASAGVAGAIILLAAKDSFESFFAGVKLAMAQVIKIGDSLEVNGIVGVVSEITLSYVILKTWENKRYMLPVNYFLSNNFVNRSYQSTELSNAVIIYTDHSAPLDQIRKAIKAFAANHSLWNKQVCDLEALESDQFGIKCRIKISAENEADLWKLQCEILEYAISWLQTHHPQALPTQRISYKTD